MKKPENPQAFASEHNVYINSSNGLAIESQVFNEGMTLRDYFAGQALASVLGTLGSSEIIKSDLIAKDCYDVADAMLKERSSDGK